jgi:hypothetical protein
MLARVRSSMPTNPSAAIARIRTKHEPHTATSPARISSRTGAGPALCSIKGSRCALTPITDQITLGDAYARTEIPGALVSRP